MRRSAPTQEGTRRKAYAALFTTILLPLGLVAAMAAYVGNESFRRASAGSYSPGCGRFGFGAA